MSPESNSFPFQTDTTVMCVRYQHDRVYQTAASRVCVCVQTQTQPNRYTDRYDAVTQRQADKEMTEMSSFQTRNNTNNALITVTIKHHHKPL